MARGSTGWWAANLWEETLLGAKCLLHPKSAAESSLCMALCGGCPRPVQGAAGLSLRVRLLGRAAALAHL